MAGAPLPRDAFHFEHHTAWRVLDAKGFRGARSEPLARNFESIATGSGVFTVEIRFLAECPHVVPAIACLQLMAIHAPENRNYDRSLKQYTMRAEHSDRLPLSLVAFEDTLPVGSVSLVECDLDSHSHLTPWVASLVVWEEYRGRGIGRALMERIETVGRSLGFPELYLYTFSAEPLYRSMGWESLGLVQPERLPESVLMVKTLHET